MGSPLPNRCLSVPRSRSALATFERVPPSLLALPRVHSARSCLNGGAGLQHPAFLCKRPNRPGLLCDIPAPFPLSEVEFFALALDLTFSPSPLDREGAIQRVQPPLALLMRASLPPANLSVAGYFMGLPEIDPPPVFAFVAAVGGRVHCSISSLVGGSTFFRPLERPFSLGFFFQLEQVFTLCGDKSFTSRVFGSLPFPRPHFSH